MATSIQDLLGPLSKFLSHKDFTKVQSKVIPSILNNDENSVIAAPTGSGKTLILEVAMLRTFRSLLVPDENLANHRIPRLSEKEHQLQELLKEKENEHLTVRQKAVYICPIKALAHEKFSHWTKMFPMLKVTIETGDQEQHRADEDNLTSVSNADIIITTPERWDSITRRWKERTILSIVNSVGLLLLDEIHTVHEERGAALEAVVSRMKAIKQAALSSGGARTLHTRFIAISGTLPNVEDFAEWLQVPPHMVFSFTNADRPVPLDIRVVGYSHDSKNPFAFDRFLSFKLFGHIRQYSEGKPSIVFCASRKETVNSAQRLYDEIREQAMSRGAPGQLEPSEEVAERANQASDKQLRTFLLLGIAFHHAAMTLSDRHLVESMFREQYIAVVCTTTTLALGVNLPTHLVVVKGTTFFKSGQREDLPLSEVAQMCGRAGRPGMDSHGVALVLTTDNKVAMYESLKKGDVFTTVESQLHRHMIEHVNAEVALRTIHSYESGVEWVKTTFFWIRLRKRPQHYGLHFTTRADEQRFDPLAFAERLIERVLTALCEEECIEVKGYNSLTLVEGQGGSSAVVDDGCPAEVVQQLSRDAHLESSRIGRCMARLYVLFGTVKTFNAEIRRLQGASATAAEARPGGGGGGDDDDDGGASDADGSGDDDAAAGGERASLHSHTTGFINDSNSKTSNCTSSNSVFAVRLHTPMKLQKALALLCHSEEFVEIRLRQGDRGPLNEMNKSIKYPIKSGKKGGREVREDWQKSYVLVQGQLAQLNVNEISLRNDFLRLWSIVPRLTRFMAEYAWATGSYSFALQADLLQRCVEQRVWNDGLVLRQVSSVSDTIARLLFRAGYRTFDDIRSADSRKIEALCSRLPPYGDQLRQEVLRIPRGTLEVTRIANQSSHKHPARFRVTVRLQDELAGRDKHQGGGSFLLVAGYADAVLLQRYVPVSSLRAPQAPLGASVMSAGGGTTMLEFEFSLPPPNTVCLPRDQPAPAIEVHLIEQHFVGNDISFTITTSGVPVTSQSRALTADLQDYTSVADARIPPAEKQPTLKPRTRTIVKAERNLHPQQQQQKASASTQEKNEAADQSANGAATALGAQAKMSYEDFLRDLAFVEGESKGARQADKTASISSSREESAAAVPAAPHTPQAARASPSGVDVEHLSTTAPSAPVTPKPEPYGLVHSPEKRPRREILASCSDEACAQLFTDAAANSSTAIAVAAAADDEVESARVCAKNMGKASKIFLPRCSSPEPHLSDTSHTARMGVRRMEAAASPPLPLQQQEQRTDFFQPSGFEWRRQNGGYVANQIPTHQLPPHQPQVLQYQQHQQQQQQAPPQKRRRFQFDVSINPASAPLQQPLLPSWVPSTDKRPASQRRAPPSGNAFANFYGPDANAGTGGGSRLAGSYTAPYSTPAMYANTVYAAPPSSSSVPGWPQAPATCVSFPQYPQYAPPPYAQVGTVRAAEYPFNAPSSAPPLNFFSTGASDESFGGGSAGEVPLFFDLSSSRAPQNESWANLPTAMFYSNPPPSYETSSTATPPFFFPDTAATGGAMVPRAGEATEPDPFGRSNSFSITSTTPGRPGGPHPWW